MAYVYGAVNKLEGLKVVGNGGCVLLLQHFGRLPNTASWHQGQRVVEQQNIWTGVAIATFESGVYPNWPTGNHAAFFVRFGARDADGNAKSIWVIEQYKGLSQVTLREIPARGQVDSKQCRRLLHHRMKSMRPILALATLLSFGAAAPVVTAADADPPEIKACPTEFPVDAVKLTPLPPGWVGIGPAKALLTSADVILGPTTRPGVQIGKQRKTRDGYTMTFDQLYLPAYEPVEKWLACRYGPHLALAQRLPEKTDRCVVTYFRNAYSGLDLQVACHTQP